MSSFIDGPAKGVNLDLRRAPVVLRVVRGMSGEFDALDQLDDVPRSGESMWLYVCISRVDRYHVCIRGGHGSGWRESGTYAFWKDAPPEAFHAEQWPAWIRSLPQFVEVDKLRSQHGAPPARIVMPEELEAMRKGVKP